MLGGRKEEYIERVIWKDFSIAYVASQVFKWFGENLPSINTSDWIKFNMTKLLPTIKSRRFQPVKLSARGYDLVFAWPPLVEIQREDFVFWQEAEPRIIVLDRSFGDLLPKERTQLYRVSDEIAREAEDVYALKTTRTPRALIFNKERYSNKIEVRKAHLL